MEECAFLPKKGRAFLIPMLFQRPALKPRVCRGIFTMDRGRISCGSFRGELDLNDILRSIASPGVADVCLRGDDKCCHSPIRPAKRDIYNVG